MMPEGEFIEIFVDTPLAEAEKRDTKGLYAKARAGELKPTSPASTAPTSRPPSHWLALPPDDPKSPTRRIDTTASTGCSPPSRRRRRRPAARERFRGRDAVIIVGFVADELGAD
jgi:hypothetical protein